METTQWAQGIGGEGLVSQQSSQQVELLEETSKKRPLREQALNCPRCNSTNTKFCYYNNYSLTQPRYFCKACKRYWTEGGSLRNVPVGGGSRKNKKRSSSINPSSSSSSSSPLPKPYQGQDLNLTLPNNSLLVGNNNFSGGGLSTMELLNNSAATSAMYGGSFGLHEFNLAGVGNGGRLLFPFGDLMSSNESDHQIKGQVGDNSMFWSGTNLGGSDGSW